MSQSYKHKSGSAKRKAKLEAEGKRAKLPKISQFLFRGANEVNNEPSTSDTTISSVTEIENVSDNIVGCDSEKIITHDVSVTELELVESTSLSLETSTTISAHEFPYDFGEGCPKDSAFMEGTCKCDHMLCDKPPCMTNLKLLTDATYTPGSCCPTYSCEGCKKEEKINGQCPCLPDAVIKSGRKCTCADPHKKLVNNTCVCDQAKCELPDLCDDRSVPVKEMDGCCEKITCMACPDDSYVTSYNDFEVEDKCVCYPCPATKCNETQTPQILRRGRNMPGKCCDIYNCVNMDPNMGCMLNGTLYSLGETWSSGENICACQQNGISFCSLLNPTSEKHGFRPCLAEGRVYNHLDTWLEDTCTNCTCNDGELKCIAYMCDIHTSEMKKSITVCPSLTDCTNVCENGFQVNELGCEICKCNERGNNLHQYHQLDELLQKYNLTENDVINIINTLQQSGLLKNVVSGNFPSIPTVQIADISTSSTTTSKTTVVPSTSICATDNNHVLGDCAYNCFLEYALPGFVIGTILGTIVVLTFRKCLQKNRKKYTMYMPVGKDAAVDKNLNLSTIIKQNTKNFELQSYNEKKNVV